MKFYSKIIFLFVIISANITFGNKVNILYTANINATYQNCNCGSDPLGGIDRIKTYFDNFRSNNPKTLVIDGGNYFNSYPFAELNNKVLESLSILKYDSLAPGVHLFFENKTIYDKYYQEFYNNIINSNSNLGLNKSKDFSVNGLKIRFLNYISPDLFKHNPKPEWLDIKNEIDEINYLQDGINILIFNGYLSDAKKLLKKYNKFEILLLSSYQQEGTWKSENTIIVGGGHDAESIALVEIVDKSESTAIDVKYIKMDNLIASDQRILNLFDNLNIKTHNDKKDL